jgi:uncharacterized membrane protein YphA (DoxX/SURF4 family)
MTLSVLITGIAVVAIALTLLEHFGFKLIKNWPISLLQNFCGALFVFSGWVKAIDPLGTAFKMEQYFAEFESVFSDTSLSFLEPLFPALNEYAIAFSVFMIVFEIALGVMLLIGAAPKFTSWAFFLLVAFFTVLTGFTYMTGYVPTGVNFFSFSEWGAYEITNMKVTDCGCFGDFIKLEPKTSFFKDIFLLVPAILFLVMGKSQHQLFTPNIRTGLTVLTVVGISLYCFSNYVWDLPHNDFRPFKKGVNVAERKAAEEEAAASVQPYAYRLVNKATGEAVQLGTDEYLANYKEYPAEAWEMEPLMTEPAIPTSKISDFDVADLEGSDVTYQILEDSDYSFMIVAYKLKGSENYVPYTRRDSVFVVDTVLLDDGNQQLVRRLDRVDEVQATATEYTWDEAYLDKWREYIQPLAEQAREAGHKIYAITAFSGAERINSFRSAIGADYPFYVADDIMLKTIIRSNPGILLMSQGTILEKWHYKKLPDFGRIKNDYRLATAE